MFVSGIFSETCWLTGWQKFHRKLSKEAINFLFGGINVDSSITIKLFIKSATSVIEAMAKTRQARPKYKMEIKAMHQNYGGRTLIIQKSKITENKRQSNQKLKARHEGS